MKMTLKILVLLLSLCAGAYAQVAPAATGPAPIGYGAGKNLNYALRYSETADFGTSLSNWQTSTVSGSLNYAGGNLRYPLSVNYSGGYTWTLTGPDYATGQFHRMLISQGIDWRKWKILVSDNVSYLPESPTTGFSGIPGIGEPIGGTPVAPTSSLSILTLNTHIVDNYAIGELEADLSHATSFIVGGTSELLRYPNNDGYNTDTQAGTGEFDWHADARNSVYGRYIYSDYSFPDYNINFVTDSELAGFRRLWSRNLSTDIAVGPERITSSSQAAVPNSSMVAATGLLHYQLGFTSADVNFSRGINSGAGYLIGGQFDTVFANFTRQFGPNFTFGLSGGYERTEELSTSGFIINATFGGAQGTWRLSRDIIVFANYTGTNQSSSTATALPSSVLNELLNVVGFGVGFSPRGTSLRQ